MPPRASQHAVPVTVLPALYVVLVLACFNAVLRPSVDVALTPYYLAFPVLAVWLAAASASFRLWLAAAALALAYGVAMGRLYGTPWPAQLAQCVKVLQALTLIATLAWLRRHDPRFAQRAGALVVGLAVAVFAFALVQQASGLEIPTVVNEESGEWLNTFFFTPNDVGLFLATASILVLASRRSWLFKLAFVGCVVELNLRNDAKAVLLALGLACAGLASTGVARRVSVPPMALLAGALAGIVMAVLGYAELEIQFNDDAVTPLTLLLDPIERIFTLDPYNLGGSVFDRTDALIHALTELKANHWLGLGPGGSVHVLTLPQYELLSAKSLHNAVAELAVDFGPVFVVPFVLVLARQLLRLCRRHPEQLDGQRAALLLALPFLAVSQSSGFISNYAFWIAAYLVWCVPAAPQRSDPAPTVEPSLSRSVDPAPSLSR